MVKIVNEIVTIDLLSVKSLIDVRNLRREINDKLKKQQKSGEISEDELANELDVVQKTVEAAMTTPRVRESVNLVMFAIAKARESASKRTFA